VVTPMFTRRPPRVRADEGRSAAYTLAARSPTTRPAGPLSPTWPTARSIATGPTSRGVPGAAPPPGQRRPGPLPQAVASRRKPAPGCSVAGASGGIGRAGLLCHGPRAAGVGSRSACGLERGPSPGGPNVRAAEALLRRPKLVLVNDTAETITAQNADIIAWRG